MVIIIKDGTTKRGVVPLDNGIAEPNNDLSLPIWMWSEGLCRRLINGLQTQDRHELWVYVGSKRSFSWSRALKSIPSTVNQKKTMRMHGLLAYLFKVDSAFPSPLDLCSLSPSPWSFKLLISMEIYPCWCLSPHQWAYRLLMLSRIVPHVFLRWLLWACWHKQQAKHHNG